MVFLLLVVVVLAAALFLVPGWKSFAALYLVYLVGFYFLTKEPTTHPICVDACDAHAAGDFISNTINGYGWLLLLSLGFVRGAMLLLRR